MSLAIISKTVNNQCYNPYIFGKIFSGCFQNVWVVALNVNRFRDKRQKHQHWRLSSYRGDYTIHLRRQGNKVIQLMGWVTWEYKDVFWDCTWRVLLNILLSYSWALDTKIDRWTKKTVINVCFWPLVSNYHKRSVTNKNKNKKSLKAP